MGLFPFLVQYQQQDIITLVIHYLILLIGLELVNQVGFMF